MVQSVVFALAGVVLIADRAWQVAARGTRSVGIGVGFWSTGLYDQWLRLRTSVSRCVLLRWGKSERGYRIGVLLLGRGCRSARGTPGSTNKFQACRGSPLSLLSSPSMECSRLKMDGWSLVSSVDHQLGLSAPPPTVTECPALWVKFSRPVTQHLRRTQALTWKDPRRRPLFFPFSLFP